MKISFGIKTHLKSEYKTLLAIHSILAQKIDDDFEILVTGNTNFTVMSDIIRSQVTLLPDEEAARNGRLAKMMNTLAAHARYDNVCLMDDDIMLLDGWYEKLELYAECHPDFQVLTFPIKNTNGSRFWDWGIWEEQEKHSRHQLLAYNESSNSVYVTGGMSCFRKSVWQDVQWDETKGLYEFEDVDWSRRLWQEEHTIDFCQNAFVLHNDWRYFYDGNHVAINKYTDISEAFHDNKHMDIESELICAQRDLLTIKKQLHRVQNKVSFLITSKEYLLGKFLLAPFIKLKHLFSK